ncbi:peptidase inhibitor 16 [Trichonephila inaurata madagascariensis]|uniref:Peptidase inhibitor 16 n=1 Tax=Trichonephila inaurata madagascariensis TaxID=2747483 RepID=A0A8X6K493_9ARAC|nr:peptidase inhibitor 16 [Trichonephila inaurata madagascariensis]
MESNSSIENISKEGLHHRLYKREYPKRGFTEELKKEILDLHNLYRGNVTPSAANMAFMEWDEDLEHLAQLWADYCPQPSGSLATYLWYEEYKHYDMKTRYCKPNEKCGHYVQVAWATSNRLGCGITKCDEFYLIVCHYHKGIRGIVSGSGNFFSAKMSDFELNKRHLRECFFSFKKSAARAYRLLMEAYGEASYIVKEVVVNSFNS